MNVYEYPHPKDGLKLTIAEFWQSFEKELNRLEPNMLPRNREAMRKLFYAGAASMYVLQCHHLTELPDLAAIAVLAKLDQELSKFHAEAIAASVVDKAKAH